jgi:hypothetical protein
MLVIVLLVALLAGCDWFQPEPRVELSPGHDVVALDATWTDAGCDLIVADETIAMTRQNEVDTSMIDEYLIRYEATHEEDTYQCFRIVKVIDDTPPVVLLQAGVDTIQVGETHVDAGVAVMDNHDPAPTIAIESDLDASTSGTYTIRYTVTDASGNTTIVVRYVTVLD